MKLYIGNRNYSSWSFRPWIAMRVAGIPFEEELVPFDDHGNEAFRAFSPTGKVPVLKNGYVTVWESLAIIEYLADRHEQLWPQDRALRAEARAISAEMHAGFSAMREECPMNMRRERRAIDISEKARADVARIAVLWHAALSRSGGPFLYGEFTAADAMYAPVVNRFDVYRLTESPLLLGYMERVKALPAYREWEAESRREPWVVPDEEV